LFGALNNGQRQFVTKHLAPRREFEVQFTALETTPPWNRFLGSRTRREPVSLMRFDGVNAFSFALGRSNLQPQLLLQLAADESTYAMGLPAGRFHGVDKQMHLGRRMSPYVSA
jgi:hypothetical protein